MPPHIPPNDLKEFLLILVPVVPELLDCAGTFVLKPHPAPPQGEKQGALTSPDIANAGLELDFIPLLPNIASWLSLRYKTSFITRS